MKVLIREKMPDGIKVQLEDWSENGQMKWCVGAYPVSKADSKYKWIRRGERFRLSLYFENKAQAEVAFDLLVTGKQALINCSAHFYNGIKDLYYLIGEEHHEKN